MPVNCPVGRGGPAAPARLPLPEIPPTLPPMNIIATILEPSPDGTLHVPVPEAWRKLPHPHQGGAGACGKPACARLLSGMAGGLRFHHGRGL